MDTSEKTNYPERSPKKQQSKTKNIYIGLGVVVLVLISLLVWLVRWFTTPEVAVDCTYHAAYARETALSTNPFFVDDQMGWIVGDLSGNPILGQVAYTANGGGYPTQQEIFDKPLYSLFFIDRQMGWAAGLDGLIVQTLNGGSDWKAIPAFTDKPIYDLYFTEDGSGWAVTGGGGIFSTRDGIEWAMEPTGIDTDIFSIHMLDESNGWACGKKNSILKRIMMEDGKASWTIIVINSVPSGQIWNDIFFLDPSTGWVVGELGQIYKTTDGGISWKNEESNVTSNLNAIYMVSQVKGWIAGDEGVVISYNAR